jgi:long-chain acyl-CoA synthetase
MISTVSVPETLDQARPLDTIPRLLRHRVAEHPDRVAFRYKHLGIWRPISWAEYGRNVEAMAYALLHLGVGPGDRVAIQSDNRPEWVFADVAAESIGAVVVGVYPTCPATELAYHLNDSGSRILIAEDQEQVDKALEAHPSCPCLEWIVVIDPKGLRHYDDRALLRLGDLTAAGADMARRHPEQLDALVQAARSSDVSCIIYTSGTTGPPKGAMLTHANAIAGGVAMAEGFGFQASDSHVAYLPLCHLAERNLTLYVSLLIGHTTSFAESAETVQNDIYEIAPTFFGAVPRIAQKMRTSVEIKIENSTWVKRMNYRFWMKVGTRLASSRIEHGYRLSLSERCIHQVGSFCLYRSLRKHLGLKNARHCIIGTAPVSRDLMQYFHAMGVPLRQTFGQTECGGASHMHRLDDIRFDTVGTTLPGYECSIDESTGEVLLAGPGVFAGYWANEEATERAMSGKWLRTGDVGEIDSDGHLRIIGRIKDIIITAGGKNISPSEIENKIKFSPYVREAIVVGEGRKFLTALIGIEFDAVANWAEKRRIPYTTYRDLSERAEVIDLIDDWVTEVNRDLARVETIKRFWLLPKELDHEDSELTATQKVRRSAIVERFGCEIEALYR